MRRIPGVGSSRGAVGQEIVQPGRKMVAAPFSFVNIEKLMSAADNGMHLGHFKLTCHL